LIGVVNSFLGVFFTNLKNAYLRFFKTLRAVALIERDDVLAMIFPLNGYTVYLNIFYELCQSQFKFAVAARAKNSPRKHIEC
jgi:hypothetical protein